MHSKENSFFVCNTTQLLVILPTNIPLIGLQFNWIGFDQTRKYVLLCAVNSNCQTRNHLYSDTSPYWDCTLPKIITVYLQTQQFVSQCEKIKVYCRVVQSHRLRLNRLVPMPQEGW